MSDTEMLALFIAAALGGIGTGLGIAFCAHTRRQDRRERRDRATESYARWLAARKRFTRATATFVESFRALTRLESQSQVVAARRAEASRARDDWRSASTDLDTGEAGMIAWSLEPDITSTRIDQTRPTSAAIRAAIDGDAEHAQQFFADLEAQDRLVADSLRPTPKQASSLAAGVQFVIRFASSVIACLDEMASRLARR